MKIKNSTLFIISIVASICLFSCISKINAEEQANITKYMPSNNSIKGFTVYKKSLVYAKGDNLSKIYDGGYELYTNNGVTEAARQMYNRKTDYIEVTIHALKSKKDAQNFFKYWCKQFKIKKTIKNKNSTSFIASKPNAIGYSVVGNYIATISAFYDSNKSVKDIKIFLNAIEQKIIKGKQGDSK